MDKLVLIFYISVKNLDYSDISNYMEDVANHLRSVDNDILNYFIPVFDGDTRVECLNPKLLSDKEYQKSLDVLERNKKATEELIKKFSEPE